MRWLSVPLLFLVLALSACASGPPSGGEDGYIGGRVPAECAPFARALTGVRLTGDAADWWYESVGRYARATRPAEGSLLVFRRTGRLPYGHVAVVSRVVSRREILVDQANWVHHRVTDDQPVIDVSERNDWSRVRVWWPPAVRMGETEYPTYGFIRPDRPVGHDQLLAATPLAIRIAVGD